MRAFLVSALVLGACATGPRAEAPTAAPVVAAERAFAARAGEVGWVPAFRAFVAPDGQLVRQGGYANAPEQLAATEDDGNRNLAWWPAFAGISRSGDFGFTTGAVSFDEARTPRGHYFTVWRRQSDGSWKWIYDGGVGPIAEAASLTEPGGDVAMAPTAIEGEANAQAAIDAVTAMERASWIHFAPDARVVRAERAIAIGVAPPRLDNVSYEPERVEASSGGDLVMVLGHMQWDAHREGRLNGLYARMWQRRADGWFVIYDQVIAPRPIRIESRDAN